MVTQAHHTSEHTYKEGQVVILRGMGVARIDKLIHENGWAAYEVALLKGATNDGKPVSIPAWCYERDIECAAGA